MVNKLIANIIVEIIESDDVKHRYSLRKEWDKDKPTCTIVTLYPGSAELILTDTTQMLITNHLYKLGYGSFYSVNLFSKLGIADRSQKTFTSATNKANDEIILDCVGKSKAVIFAWGSLPDTNKVVKQRVGTLLSKLAPYLDKCFYLSDAGGEECFHPLAAKIRHEWNLTTFEGE